MSILHTNEILRTRVSHWPWFVELKGEPPWTKCSDATTRGGVVGSPYKPFISARGPNIIYATMRIVAGPLWQVTTQHVGLEGRNGNKTMTNRILNLVHSTIEGRDLMTLITYGFTFPAPVNQFLVTSSIAQEDFIRSTSIRAEGEAKYPNFNTQPHKAKLLIASLISKTPRTYCLSTLSWLSVSSNSTSTSTSTCQNTHLKTMIT